MPVPFHSLPSFSSPSNTSPLFASVRPCRSRAYHSLFHHRRSCHLRIFFYHRIFRSANRFGGGDIDVTSVSTLLILNELCLMLPFLIESLFGNVDDEITTLDVFAEVNCRPAGDIVVTTGERPWILTSKCCLIPMHHAWVRTSCLLPAVNMITGRVASPAMQRAAQMIRRTQGTSSLSK